MEVSREDLNSILDEFLLRLFEKVEDGYVCVNCGDLIKQSEIDIFKLESLREITN